jgi:hypothetical protein
VGLDQIIAVLVEIKLQNPLVMDLETIMAAVVLAAMVPKALLLQLLPGHKVVLPLVIALKESLLYNLLDELDLPGLALPCIVLAVQQHSPQQQASVLLLLLVTCLSMIPIILK